MKILHCSDIHLGKRPFGTETFSSKRYNDYYLAFNQLADVAIANRVEVFMISGDLFDKRELSPDNLIKSEEIFYKLKCSNIEVLIIEGNHDNSNKYDEINSWLHYLEEKKYARRLTYKKENEDYIFTPFIYNDVYFYGLGYPGFIVDKVIEALSENLDSKNKNIVMVHTALGGGDHSLPGLVSTEALNLLKDKVLYVAGGHFHSKYTYPKENPYFYIPGSSEYWNIINEKDSEKGAFILDSHTGIVNFIAINPRKRMVETIEISNKDNLKEYIDDFSKNMKLTGEELLVIKLKLNSNIYVNTTEIEKIFEENGALKAYVLPIFYEVKERSDSINTSSSIFDIEENVINNWNGINSMEVVKHLQNLKEYQKTDDSSRFLETFDLMLEGMIKNENS